MKFSKIQNVIYIYELRIWQKDWLSLAIPTQGKEMSWEGVIRAVVEAWVVVCDARDQVPFSYLAKYKTLHTSMSPGFHHTDVLSHLETFPKVTGKLTLSFWNWQQQGIARGGTPRKATLLNGREGDPCGSKEKHEVSCRVSKTVEKTVKKEACYSSRAYPTRDEW